MDNLARWLIDTTSSDEAAMRTASAELAKAEKLPGFGEGLLQLSSLQPPQPCSLPAAVHFKNFVRKHWGDFEEEDEYDDEDLIKGEDGEEDKKPVMSPADRVQLRKRLLEVVVVVDGPILRVLAEALRLVTMHDFKQESSWNELIPSLRSAIQQSNLMGGMQGSQIRTYNALVAVNTIIKPFQYLQNPQEDKEPVPEQLEQICKQLLDPSLDIYKAVVGQALATEQVGAAEHDRILHVLCKAYHRAIRYHMPPSLLANEPIWTQGLLALLDLPVVNQPRLAEEQQPRLKASKRALQACNALVTRHRKQSDKHVQRMCAVALKIVGAGAQMQGLAPMQERVVSLAFDLLGSILETGPGWRHLSPHFAWLLEGAIFPALKLQPKDVEDWEDDEEEYLQKNLPNELDDVSGWRDDLYVPRKSAVNLLGVMAEAKALYNEQAPGASPSGPKRRARRTGSKKADENAPKVGDVMVLPFLNNFQPPPPNSPPTSEPVANYCGVVMGYAALHKFLSKKPGGAALAGLQSRVLPLLHPGHKTPPYLLASACWLLGEYASSISESEDVSQEAYAVLCNCLCLADMEPLSLGPVRAAAAGALNALLQEECRPKEWIPLLQLLVSRTRLEDEDEATRAYNLITMALDAARDKVALAIPDLVEALVDTVSSKLPEDKEEMWSDVVEAGFAALSTLCEVLDNPEADDDEDSDPDTEVGPDITKLREELVRSRRPGPEGIAKVADSLSRLLQRCWLLPPPEPGAEPLEPPSSALNNASLLLACLCRHTITAAAVQQRKVEELLLVWGELLREWSAWEEEEDEAAFDAIDEAIKLHARTPLPHFLTAPSPPAPAPPVPPLSPFEAIGIFLAHCIEDGNADVVWRACKRGHTLLHCSAVSFDSSKAVASRLAEEAMRRLMFLGDLLEKKPVAKPLVLLIATCLLCCSEAAGPALGKALEESALQGVLFWGRAMATVATRGEVGLHIESECKLAALSLVKLVEVLSSSSGGQAEGEVASFALEGAVRALLRLKEAKSLAMGEASEEEEETEEDVTDSEDEDEEAATAAEQEETEQEYIKRLQRIAKEEDDLDEEEEGGAEEDGQDLDLGVLALSDEVGAVLNCFKLYGRNVLSAHPLKDSALLGAFVDAYPQAQGVLS